MNPSCTIVAAPPAQTEDRSRKKATHKHLFQYRTEQMWNIIKEQQATSQKLKPHHRDELWGKTTRHTRKCLGTQSMATITNTVSFLEPTQLVFDQLKLVQCACTTNWLQKPSKSICLHTKIITRASLSPERLESDSIIKTANNAMHLPSWNLLQSSIRVSEKNYSLLTAELLPGLRGERLLLTVS